MSGSGILLNLVLKETPQGLFVLAERVFPSCQSYIGMDETVALSDMMEASYHCSAPCS